MGSTSLQAPWRVVNSGWFQLTGLPWIPPRYAWGAKCPIFKGISSQAHTLVRSLNVAKCNLGRVKFQADVISDLTLKCRWSVGWLSAWAFCLSCQLRCISCWHLELIIADLVLLLHLSDSLWILAPTPSPPALVSTGMGSGEYFHWKAGVVLTRTWLPWIPPCYAWGDQAPVQPGTSTQAHLLVISLTTPEVCTVLHIHVSHKSQTSSTSSLHKDLIREWLRDFKSRKGF